jgi:hypothetical protein
VEELLDGPDRPLRRLEEGVDRGLGLGGQLLDRQRPVADRDAVATEQLAERRLEGVRAAPDQQRHLSRHGSGERDDERDEDEEAGAVCGRHDQEP